MPEPEVFPGFVYVCVCYVYVLFKEIVGYLGTCLCVPGSMCPGFYVSQVLCVPGSMCPGFYVSRVLCVPIS